MRKDPFETIADEWDSPTWKSAAAAYHADREPIKAHTPKVVPLNGGAHGDNAPLVPAADLTEAFTFLGDTPAAPPRELIKGLIPAEGIVVTGGQSSAGKTFIQIHKSICLATTKPYFGRKIIERTGTVFVAAEGRPLLPNRFAAALAKLSVTEKLPITWLKALPDFSSPEGVNLFIAQLKALDEKFRGDFGVRLGNTVIDTVAACFGMKNEDDNAEATGVCNVMRRKARKSVA
jgi:hypothetical protein